jgi:hypothetical protein
LQQSLTIFTFKNFIIKTRYIQVILKYGESFKNAKNHEVSKQSAHNNEKIKEPLLKERHLKLYY